jgi:hypothetical protein
VDEELEQQERQWAMAKISVFGLFALEISTLL